MTQNDIYSFVNILLERSKSTIPLNVAPDSSKTSIVKVEIDGEISSDIRAKDVLYALQECDCDGDSTDIVINGCTYSCDFIKPKALTFTLGKTPKCCENVNEQYLGTVCVSIKRNAPHPGVKDCNNLGLQYSYKKFHKVIPFGFGKGSYFK